MQPEFRTFAREAEGRYRELEELARSLGLDGTASLLQERADWMKSLEATVAKPDEFRTSLFEVESATLVREALLELRQSVDACLDEWPPESPQGLNLAIERVQEAVDRLTRLGQIEGPSGRLAGRRRDRWGAEPPAAQDPPTFQPGKKKRP